MACNTSSRRIQCSPFPYVCLSLAPSTQMIYSSSSTSSNWNNIKNHRSWNLLCVSTSLHHAKPHWALGRNLGFHVLLTPGWYYSYLKGGDLEDRTSYSAKGRTMLQTCTYCTMEPGAKSQKQILNGLTLLKQKYQLRAQMLRQYGIASEAINPLCRHD